MNPRFQERHQDYVCGPNQFSQLSSVSANMTGPVTLPFRLDPDAPFLLRGLAVRKKYTSAESPDQDGLQNLKFRFSGPELDYLQQALIRASLWGPYYGQAGNPIPYYPQVLYPAGSTIYIDFMNTGSSALTNLTFYFRGVKLYPFGTQPMYQYPPRCSTLPFTYALTYADLAVSTASNGVRSIFRPKTDSDFVLRALQAGPAFSRTSYEVFLRLLDENEHAYSNDFVHVDVIAGRTLMPAAYPSGTSLLAPTGTGASRPGLLYPEVYVPRGHILYYDLLRSDTGYTGAAAEDFPVQFMGAKVFPR